MKRITFICIALLGSFVLFAGNPTWTRVWELSATLGTNPTYIGTASYVRGMGFGSFQGQQVVVVPTREGTMAVKLISAADGSESASLNVTGVTGGTFAISDAGVTTDGKILVSNMVNASGGVFKVYQWSNTTDAPTVAISYTLSAAYRIGDHMTVKGSIADGTAKVYVVSGALVSAVAPVFCFSMVSDGNGGYVFDSNPAILSSSITATGGYPSIDFFPDGSFINKYNGSQIRKYNSDGSYTSQESSSSLIATGGNSVKYLLTKTAVSSGDPDTVYVAYFRYGTGQERANIVKFPAGAVNDAATEVSVYLPALGTNANGNGAGRVAVDVSESGVYVYVLSSNNGLGKYQITWPEVTTSTAKISNETVSVLAASGELKIAGVDSPDVELFSVVGQRVKQASGVNVMSVAGLKGVYVVKVMKNGQLLNTTKVNL